MVELVEVECPDAVSPEAKVVELAGLHTATQLECVSRRVMVECVEVGSVCAWTYVALKARRDESSDVCRICLSSGLVRPAEESDEVEAAGDEKLLRDCCACRGSIGAVHASCLLRTQLHVPAS